VRGWRGEGEDEASDKYAHGFLRGDLETPLFLGDNLGIPLMSNSIRRLSKLGNIVRSDKASLSNSIRRLSKFGNVLLVTRAKKSCR